MYSTLPNRKQTHFNRSDRLCDDDLDQPYPFSIRNFIRRGIPRAQAIFTKQNIHIIWFGLKDAG